MNKKLFLYALAMTMVLVMSVGFTSCSSNDEDNNNAIAEYVGTWICTYPETHQTATVVTEGTPLIITSSGDMAWTLPDGSRYNARMRALGDSWADITYNGITYRAEIYVRDNILVINVNGNTYLKEKDFPFDGTYEKMSPL